MPRILEIKVDERGQVWCCIGRISHDQGSVLLLTDGELNHIRTQERLRISQIVGHLINNIELHEKLLGDL